MTEKKSLLQEISDLMDAGIDIVKQKQIDAEKRKKEDQKKMMLKKKGKDIRKRAMEGLKGNTAINMVGQNKVVIFACIL